MVAQAEAEKQAKILQAKASRVSGSGGQGAAEIDSRD